MIEAHYIPSLTEPAKRIEFFANVPSAEAPRPAVLYVHGHQHPARPGGGVIARSGLLERLAAAGVLGVSLSQPRLWRLRRAAGLLRAENPKCDPCSLAARRGRLGTLPGCIAIIGASRGAIAVAAADAPELGALVVSAGVYNLAAGYRDCPWSGIRKNIEQEAGTSAEAFRARSALAKAHLIRCPVLIMHGASDDRFMPEQAERFAQALAKREAPVELKIFLDEGHVISRARFLREAHGFVNRHLGIRLPLE